MQFVKSLSIIWNNLSNAVTNPAYRLDLSKTVVGDFRRPIYIPEAFPDLLRKDSAKYFIINFKPETQEGNRFLSAPLLLNFLREQDPKSKADYEANRSIHFDHLPTWGQVMIREIIWKRYQDFDPFEKRYNPNFHTRLKTAPAEALSSFKQSIAESRDRLKTEKSEDPDIHISMLGLKAFATLPQFDRYITAASKLLYSDLIIKERFVEQATEFTVGNYGPLGMIALKTLKEVIPLMFAIQLINDCVRAAGLQLNSNDLQAWAKECSSQPWRFCNKKNFQNILLLSSFVHRNKIVRSSIEFQELASQAFQQKDIDTFLRKTFPEYHISNLPFEVQRDPNLEIKAGLTQAVKIYCPSLKPDEAKYWSRMLYLAIRKAGIKYEVILEKLQNGVSPEIIYNQSFFDILKDNKIGNTTGTQSSNVNKTKIDLPEVRVSVTKSYNLKSYFSYSDLKYELGHNAFQRVKKAIENMQKGHFGDITYLGDSILESKLHLLAGYRIYYSIIGKDIHLFRVGKKADQTRDIEYVKKIAKTLSP